MVGLCFVCCRQLSIVMSQLLVPLPVAAPRPAICTKAMPSWHALVKRRNNQITVSAADDDDRC
jgi:hypothetical protein